MINESNDKFIIITVANFVKLSEFIKYSSIFVHYFIIHLLSYHLLSIRANPFQNYSNQLDSFYFKINRNCFTFKLIKISELCMMHSNFIEKLKVVR